MVTRMEVGGGLVEIGDGDQGVRLPVLNMEKSMELSHHYTPDTNTTLHVKYIGIKIKNLSI